MGRIRVSVVQIVNEREQNVNVVAALEIHYIRGCFNSPSSFSPLQRNNNK